MRKDEKLFEAILKMKLYTFFFEYKGGTYIYQARGETLEEALKTWADVIPPDKIEGADNAFREVLHEGIEDAIRNKGITPIKEVTNVWCCSFLFGDDSMGLLTVTSTAED